MQNKKYVLMFLLSILFKIFAQNQFIKVYGTGSIERALCLSNTREGYIFSGYQAENTTAPHYITLGKCDMMGNLLWYEIISAPNIYDARPYSIIMSSDSSYTIGGYFEDNLTRDFFILKTNRQGNILWANAIGGGDEDMGISLIETTDKGYIMIGHTWSFGVGLNDFMIIKLDSEGNLKWAETIGGYNNEIGMSIIQTNDGGFALLGNTHSFGAGGSDFLLVKLDLEGNLEWAKTLGGADWEAPMYKSLFQTRGGGIYNYRIYYEFRSRIL